MKGILTIIGLSLLVSGCSGPEKRNKWQKPEEFSQRRPVYYNEFVQSGGMSKNDQNTHQNNNPIQKEIQDSLNQGRLLSSLQ